MQTNFIPKIRHQDLAVISAQLVFQYDPGGTKNPNIFLNGQTPTSFYLFSFFSDTNFREKTYRL